MKHRKLLLTTITLLSVVIYFSCRKTEKVFTETESAIESKFFKTNASSDPIVSSISDNIKRQNKQRNFVDKLSKNAGLPFWDKATIAEPPTTVLTKLAKTDSVLYRVFIPFVKENTDYVNAVLIVSLKKADTIFKLVYGSQYDDFGFNEKQKGEWNAKNIFHVFAIFNKQIFGHRNFLVKDKRLFFGNDLAAKDSFRVNFTDSSSQSGQNRIAGSTTICHDFAVEVPCKAFRTEADYFCYRIQIECTTYWLDGGGGGTGGGGGGTGGGGTGGGGDGGTGWTGDPCPPEPEQRTSVLPSSDPCGDIGWEPVGDESMPQAIIANQLNSILAPGDNYYFDNSLTTSNSLLFTSVSDFVSHLTQLNNNITYNLATSETIINQNEKIETAKINLTFIGGVEIFVNLTKVGANWTISSVTSDDYGITLGWSWAQQTFTQNTTATEIIVDVYGYIKYNIIFDGIGTVYKQKQHYQLKINPQTGKIFYLAKL